MKKSVFIALLAVANAFSCTTKKDNAVDEIKKAFPELKNATATAKPSISGDFGILLTDKSNPRIEAYVTGTDQDGDGDLQSNDVKNTYIAIIDPRETHNRGIIASLKDSDQYRTTTEPVNAPDLPFNRLVPLGTKIPSHAFYLYNRPLQHTFAESMHDLATSGRQLLDEEKQRWSEEIKQPALPTPIVH